MTWLGNVKDVSDYKIAGGAKGCTATAQRYTIGITAVHQANYQRNVSQRAELTKTSKMQESQSQRDMQLKSGHAVTGAYLLRFSKAHDAHCWWSGGVEQIVGHLLLKCRRWRRQRGTMLRKLGGKNVSISERRDREDLQTLFRAAAAVDVLQFLDHTDVGKRMLGEAGKDDLWVIGRLDRSDEEKQMAMVIGDG